MPQVGIQMREHLGGTDLGVIFKPTPETPVSYKQLHQRSYSAMGAILPPTPQENGLIRCRRA
jgi:hypothetical protein